MRGQTVHKSKYLFAWTAEEGYASHHSECQLYSWTLSAEHITRTSHDGCREGNGFPTFPPFQRPDLILSHKGSIVTIRR